MDQRGLRLGSCVLAIVSGAAGCGTGEPSEAIEETPSALMFGTCVVPKNFATATFYGHQSIGANTASATAGDSLLSQNNIILGTYPAGTTVIVGFQGLNQTSASLSGDTFIRLFDNNGQVAYGDDACGTLGSRVVYTVPQGNRTLTARLGCYSSGSCAGDLVKWSRLDSNGQLTNVVAAHNAINIGSNADGSPGPNGGTYGGTSVRQLTDWVDGTTNHFYAWGDVVPDRVAPVQGGGQGYIQNGTFVSYSHFEGVQRLRNMPGWVAVAGAFRADVMFGTTGTNSSAALTPDTPWLSAGATAAGFLAFRYSNYDVGAAATDSPTNVTQFNHFGGIQTSGSYIIAGVSNYPNADPPYGRLVLLDASSPANVGATGTMRKWMIDPEVMAGNTKGIGPSQTAMTKLQSGAFLMAMSWGDQTRFHFFLKDIDEGSTVLTPSYVSAGFADIEDGTFGTPSVPNTHGWMVQDGTAGVNGPDNDSLALVTQTDGSVFLLATKWVNPSISNVQQVVLTPTSSGSPKYTPSIGVGLSQKAGYQCAGSSVACNFMGAAGFYINSFDDTLLVYSTNMFLNSSSPPTIGVSEFTSNMAYGRSVSSSSANTSTPPSNATNGNLSDAAKTLSNASPWSYLDLGSTKTVTGIKIYPCGGCVQPTNFSVYSWNGSGWILQVNHPGAMQANAPESLTFPGPVQTQYVLIQINGTSSLEVSEYQVY